MKNYMYGILLLLVSGTVGCEGCFGGPNDNSDAGLDAGSDEDSGAEDAGSDTDSGSAGAAGAE